MLLADVSSSEPEPEGQIEARKMGQTALLQVTWEEIEDKAHTKLSLHCN